MTSVDEALSMQAQPDVESEPRSSGPAASVPLLEHEGSSPLESRPTRLGSPWFDGLRRYLLVFSGHRAFPDPGQLHAAVGRLLDDLPAPERANALQLSPHSAAAKPWSAWWHPFDGGGELEIGGVGDALGVRLVHRLGANPRLRLGNAQLSFLAWPGEPSETLEWAEALAPIGARSARVRFTTPTMLRTGGQATPWMDPSSLMSSLTARWQAFAPEDTLLPSTAVRERATLRVRDVTGTTERVRLPHSGRSSEPAFVGEIIYAGDDAETFARFASLLRMAEFLGAGARTQYGLGRVRVEFA